MRHWSRRSGAIVSLTIFPPVDVHLQRRFLPLTVTAGRLALWHDLLFRALLLFAAGRLLGSGSLVLLLLLQIEALRREAPLSSLPGALWVDRPAACWMSRWLLVFRGRDALGQRRRIALFADQLTATDHARLRRLLLRLQSGQPLSESERFDLL